MCQRFNARNTILRYNIDSIVVYYNKLNINKIKMMKLLFNFLINLKLNYY
jgi:hypothetical protein